MNREPFLDPLVIIYLQVAALKKLKDIYSLCTELCYSVNGKIQHECTITTPVYHYNASVPLQHQCVVLVLYVKGMLKITQIIVKILCSQQVLFKCSRVVKSCMAPVNAQYESSLDTQWHLRTGQADSKRSRIARSQRTSKEKGKVLGA